MSRQLGKAEPMSFHEQLAARAIDRAIPVPYYYQIAQFLREVIEDSDIDPDQGEVPLPSSRICARSTG